MGKNKVKKQKFYVIWHGRRTGVCESWPECRGYTDGVTGAMFKSFEDYDEATEAFEKGPPHYYLKWSLAERGINGDDCTAANCTYPDCKCVEA